MSFGKTKDEILKITGDISFDDIINAINFLEKNNIQSLEPSHVRVFFNNLVPVCFCFIKMPTLQTRKRREVSWLQLCQEKAGI